MTIDELIEQAKARKHLPPPAERKRLRVNAGISLRQLAEALGVPHSSISQWENGVNEPRNPSLPAYADALRRLAELETEP